MKALLAILLTVSTIQDAPAQAPSPLLGRWAVDISRIPIPPEARPKSVTFTFSDAGAGKWRTDVEILGGDGSARRMTSIYALDGTASPIDGDTAEADVVAVKIPAPNVMVMELGKGGMPASTRVYTVAPDGSTMIETAARTGEDGKPAMRTNYFSRIR